MAKFNTVFDRFNQTTLNSSFWAQFTAGGATMSYASGGATVNYPASSTSTTDGDLATNSTFDLTGCQVSLHYVTVPSSSTHADAAFGVQINSSNKLLWLYEAGTLYAQKVVSGTITDITSIAWNASTTNYLRIRERGGTTYWDYSGDGITWTNLTSASNPITVTSLTGIISGTCYQNETSPGSFEFNNWNITPISVIQRNSANATAASVSAAFGSNTKVGNAIVVLIATDDTTLADIGTPTDTQTNTFTLLDSYVDSTNFMQWKLFIAYNTAGGADTVSVGISSYTGSLFIWEVAGLAQSAVYDGKSAIHTTAVSPYTSNNVTTTNPNDLLIGFALNNGTSTTTYGLGSGYSNLMSQTPNYAQGATEEQVVSSTGSYNSTFTASPMNGELDSWTLALGDAPIVIPTTRTQLGKSRITAKTTKTQSGKANILATTPKASPAIDQSFDFGTGVGFGQTSGTSPQNNYGETWVSGGGILQSVKFRLNGFSATGSVVVRIYATTGSAGSLNTTGAALAVSNSFDPSSLTSTDTLVNFTFSGANQIRLTPGTAYAAMVEPSITAGNINTLADSSSDYPGGNALSGNTLGGGGTAFGGRDTYFYAYVVPPQYQFGQSRITQTTPQTQLGKANIVYPALSTFQDAFPGSTLDTTKWSSYGGSQLTVTSSQLQIVIPTNTNAGTYYGMDSVGYYNLTDSYAAIQLVTPGDGTTLASLDRGFQTFVDGSNTLAVVIYGTSLLAKKKVAGTWTTVATLAFNSSTMVWFRIRHTSSGNSVYWDYSADGITWTNYHTETSPFAITRVGVDVNAGVDANETATTTVVFDNFNVLPMTSTQTITGKTRITATTTQAQLGKARITATTTKTQLGKSRVTAQTQQTQTGKARITATTLRTQLGKGAVLRTTTQTQLGHSRITLVTAHTQTGLARITVTTPQAQPGKSRITVTTLKTQLGRARITATTLQMQLGKAAVKNTTLRTQAGLARVTASTLRTQTGITRITVTTLRTQLGKAAIKRTTTQTLQGLSRITLITTKTQPGKANINNNTLQAITGIARVTTSTLRTLLGRSRVTVTTAKTQLGLGDILRTTPQAQTGQTRVTVATARTQLGRARVTASATRTQTGVSRITRITLQTLSGLARITDITSKTLLGISRVTASTSRTQKGLGRVTQTAAQQQNGQSRVTVITAHTVIGGARITTIVPANIAGLSRVTASTQRAMLGVGNVNNDVIQTQVGKGSVAVTTTRTTLGAARITPWAPLGATIYLDEPAATVYFTN